MCDDSCKEASNWIVAYPEPSERQRLSLKVRRVTPPSSPSMLTKNLRIVVWLGSETPPEPPLMQQGCTVKCRRITFGRTFLLRNSDIDTLTSPPLLSPLWTTICIDSNLFLVVLSLYFFFWLFPGSQSTDMCPQARITSVLIRIPDTNPLAFWSHRPSLKAMMPL